MMHLKKWRRVGRRIFCVVACAAVMHGTLAIAAGEYEQSLRLAGQSQFEEAFALILPLAQRGERKAQYIIGESFYWGTGVAQDREAAVKWYRKAADAGLPEAKFNLAHAYKKGIGVRADPARCLFCRHGPD